MKISSGDIRRAEEILFYVNSYAQEAFNAFSRALQKLAEKHGIDEKVNRDSAGRVLAKLEETSSVLSESDKLALRLLRAVADSAYDLVVDECASLFDGLAEKKRVADIVISVAAAVEELLDGDD